MGYFFCAFEFSHTAVIEFMESMESHFDDFLT